MKQAQDELILTYYYISVPAIKNDGWNPFLSLWLVMSQPRQGVDKSVQFHANRTSLNQHKEAFSSISSLSIRNDGFDFTKRYTPYKD